MLQYSKKHRKFFCGIGSQALSMFKTEPLKERGIDERIRDTTSIINDYGKFTEHKNSISDGFYTTGGSQLSQKKCELGL